MFVGSVLRNRAVPMADWSAGLAAIRGVPRCLVGDVRESVALARRFNRDVVRPLALRLDADIQDDPQLLPHEFIAEANRRGLYTRWLPKIMGGGGHSFLALNAFVEELSAECVALANVVGVHYLGVAALSSTWNLALSQRIYADVVRGARTGRPCILSLAITEPGAGSDAEEIELAARGVAGCSAVPAPGGGYLLNGRKAFISNGHVAGWHIVVTCEDRRRVPDTAMVLAVPRGAAGLSLGAHEHKMGQRACVASELVFENCHVPAAQVAHDRAGSARLGRPHAEIMQTALDYVVSSTRAGVGAFATGVAAGAYRAAAGYAHTQRTPDGTRLAELQWVQTLLADLAGNAMLARMSYLESSYANTMAGMYALLAESPLRPLERWAPGRPLAALVAPILRLPLTTRLLKRHFLGRYPKQRQRLTSGLGSLAKITCSDLAVANAHLAIDLLGADGLRHEHGVEKRLRDAKLLQIYEGTNQINRVNLFKCLLRENDDVPVFVREDDPTPQPPSRDSPAAGVDAASPPGEPVDPATAPVPAPESAAVPAGAG